MPLKPSIQINVKLLNEHAPLPALNRKGDAGFDLRAATDGVIMPLERSAVACGLAIEIPPGYAGLLVPRSGLAAKHGISIVNAPGLIDSGYRGEIKAILLNTDAHEPFSYKAGDRIAQLVMVEVPTVVFNQTDCLSPSERGNGGFGSTGMK